MAARQDADSEHRGWNRRNWLAEKISSGELSAPTCELTARCDEFFVGEDRLEDHARVLAGCASVSREDGGADSGSRSAALLVYLQRLLGLREMWARERC